MKKQDKDFILKYKKNIITAGKYDYTSVVPHYALSRLQEIYNEETNSNLNENLSCSRCVLNLLKLFYQKIYINIENERTK